jgi:hypothetical protein
MIQYFKVNETLKPAFGENISADDVVVEEKKKNNRSLTIHQRQMNLH